MGSNMFRSGILQGDIDRYLRVGCDMKAIFEEKHINFDGFLDAFNKPNKALAQHCLALSKLCSEDNNGNISRIPFFITLSEYKDYNGKSLDYVYEEDKITKLLFQNTSKIATESHIQIPYNKEAKKYLATATEMNWGELVSFDNYVIGKNPNYKQLIKVPSKKIKQLHNYYDIDNLMDQHLIMGQ